MRLCTVVACRRADSANGVACALYIWLGITTAQALSPTSELRKGEAAYRDDDLQGRDALARGKGIPLSSRRTNGLAAISKLHITVRGGSMSLSVEAADYTLDVQCKLAFAKRQNMSRVTGHNSASRKAVNDDMIFAAVQLDCESDVVCIQNLVLKCLQLFTQLSSRQKHD